ncbi:MAG: hypothetical protein D3924_19485 [Candidatus Electrothrix sp. AR4]|nr:hypothetical protein [Candidatus Electrothrix sp. AR4]
MIDESKRWPESFPDRWASEWGEDEHGLWMAFHFQKLRHVMRWIGNFSISGGRYFGVQKA